MIDQDGRYVPFVDGDLEPVHTHVHSEGSFLDGYAKVEQIARRARELGQPSIAITDHGEVNQHLAFQKACLKEGIKPIFGMEGYWAPDIQACKDLGRYPTEHISHLCLLARNNQGLKDLWAMSSIAYDDAHFYHRPMADPDLLRQYGANLYASDGCIMTGLGRAIRVGDEDAARQYLGGLLDIFGERLYCELHTWQYMHPSDEDWVKWEGEPITTLAVNKMMTDLNQAKVRLATEMGIPMVVVNDAHHAYPEHWAFKEMVWGFKKEDNPDQQEGKGQKADHLMCAKEIHFWMERHGIARPVIDQAIRYSRELGEQCNAEIKPTLSLPRFTKSEADDFQLFLDKVEAGFRVKVEQAGLPREEYWRRMETEVSVIAQKRLAGYFLVVEDYVRAARDGTWAQYVYGGAKIPMLVGFGRGSAGGSLVSWLMGITSINPIKYGLLFERFLAPHRAGYPDIDIDFPRSKRKGVRDYVRKRWGEDRVCSICTMTRNQAKASVWDLGRALEITDSGDLGAIAKLVAEISKSDWEEEGGESADEDTQTWAEIMQENYKELSPWIAKYPALFQNLNHLHGIIRSTNVHAAAVLISEEPFAGRIPTRVKKGTLMTQFDMYGVEELGGLKGDLLSLRHLDALEIAADLVKGRHGVDIDYEAFTDEHYNDPAIWEQIDNGQTVGIFQLGTPGGTDAAMEFRPRSMVDVADLIAINRPGVRDAGLYNVYLRRRAGVEEVVYDHPLMENITKDTFGVLVYQEQLMQASVELAGFTAAESYDLNKAISKKVMEKVLAFKDKFIKGCSNNPEYALGCGDPVNQTLNEKREREIAEKIWASIEASGRYCFNKSHAVGYALISHAQIWMKHYYPPEMLVGFMMVDEAKRNRYVRDARRIGLDIQAPHVNLSRQNFTIEGNSIRYGVQAVRGIGEAGANALVAGQPYESLDDYLKRAKDGANKTACLALARLGALDCFGDRAEILKRIEYHRVTDKLAKSTLNDPVKLQKIVSERMEKNPGEWVVDIPNFANPMVVYEIEKELIGSFVTVDPMAPYLTVINAEGIRNPAAIKRANPGQQLVIGGQIIKFRKHKVGKGHQKGMDMAFLGVEWQGDIYDITVFPRAYEKHKYLFDLGKPVLCGCERLERGVSLVRMWRLDLKNDG